ncbi:MAG: D-alanine--D-alanine ligase [Alistipes sp.]|nr:D-alanine--D-alanine ligase [Alistipes sp.]MBR0394286.1 D-alanine--D-alanine ligase [Alistipes sp.]
MSNRLKIALLAGGNSSEREIALQSAQQIAEALDATKYDVKVIDLHYRDWVYTAPDGKRYDLDKNDFSLTVEGERTEFEYALIIIHGTPGEDGKLQGYLDMMGIPYSSCSQVSSTITFDKISTKRAVADRGINLAREVLLQRGDVVDSEALVAELGLPMFVKPNASGSSFGVSRVTSAEQIAEAVEAAFAESEEVLVEECITGREMGCGILITADKEYILPITEIVSKKAFFDYEAKYTAGMSDEITPAPISDEIRQRLNEATRTVYKACRCRGIVRIDFIVTEQGEPYMIEVNSIPGMSGGSIVPKQARAMGITLGELFDIVIEDTLRK